MSSDQPTVLLVEDDPATLQALRMVLSQEGKFRVETASNGREALSIARFLRPDLILTDYLMPEVDGFELCRRLKSVPDLAHAMYVLISGLTDASLKVRGLEIGIDDYLTKPVDAAELIAKIRAMLRTKRLNDQLRQDKNELERLHAELGESFQQVLRLLVHLLDMCRPGAGQRGQELAAVALEVADAFNVPHEFRSDLRVAALLHEIGKIVVDEENQELADRWRYTAMSSAVLQQVAQLRTAAELVESIYENWDGSGMPGHRQRGEIPLRSRILRVLIDYIHHRREAEETGVANAAEVALAHLNSHAGTSYDPVVLTTLEDVLSGRPGPELQATHSRIPIRDLAEGMVLAEDLTTGSGVKLLARGSHITAGHLDIIRRRHHSDPIICGATVLRRLEQEGPRDLP